MVIRKRKREDIEEWINVNISSWNEHLKGVVSDRILTIINNNKEARIRKEKAFFIEDDNHYVIEENEKVIGILKLKQSDREGLQDCGEIQVLYLLGSFKNKGYGKKLLLEAFKVLKQKNFNKVVVGCLVGNSSNGFYQHMGGICIKQDSCNLFDEHYIENVYFYQL